MKDKPFSLLSNKEMFKAISKSKNIEEAIIHLTHLFFIFLDQQLKHIDFVLRQYEVKQ